MATVKAVIVVYFVYFITDCQAFGFIDNFFEGVTPCEASCEATYTLHTYERATDLRVCQRGCRLFTIIDFAADFNSLNDTRDACAAACKEAYAGSQEVDACVQGCNSQVITASKQQRQLEQYYNQETSFLYPLLYVHSMYSNMVDKLQNHMSVSWSFYAQSDNGRLVVMRSEPKVFIDGVESPLEYKTSNYVETNIEPVDNSATPNLKHSQMHAMEREANGYQQLADDEQADWLSCISHRTGMPRLFLSLIILLSAMVMIWLCVTTAVTAPDHKIKVQPQKLSFFGDLDYLREFEEKKMLTSVRPQVDGDEAALLPIKIKVQAI